MAASPAGPQSEVLAARDVRRRLELLASRRGCGDRSLRSPATQAVVGRSLAGAHCSHLREGAPVTVHCVPRPRRILLRRTLGTGSSSDSTARPGRSTSTCSTRAPTATSTASSAPTPTTRGPGSRCGRPTPPGSPSSVTSPVGTTSTRWTPVSGSGLWTAHVPGAQIGQAYRYAITTYDGDRLEKADPVATATTEPPATASVIADLTYTWGDAAWMADRAGTTVRRGPGVDLRGPPRVVGPSPRARAPLPPLRGAGRPPRRPRRGPRVHPRRAAPGDGAPVLRLVGVPDDGATSPRPRATAPPPG